MPNLTQSKISQHSSVPAVSIESFLVPAETWNKFCLGRLHNSILLQRLSVFVQPDYCSRITVGWAGSPKEEHLGIIGGDFCLPNALPLTKPTCESTEGKLKR